MLTSTSPSPQPSARSLALFAGASVLVHAAALLLLPAASAPVKPVAVIDVTLSAIEPPRPIAPQPIAKPPAKKREPPPLVREERVRLPRSPPPVALPEPAAPSQPAFTVREEAQRPAPPPGPEAPIARAAPPPAKPEAAAEKPAPYTPPAFNAAYLRNPEPRYPISARRRGEEGTVKLKVLVTREGAASSVSVDTTSGSPALDQAAVEAVRSWRFVPARQGGSAVEAWVIVPIVFRLVGA